ncbi:MAG: hypothetical protein ACR2KL_04125 [Nocardioidaceae bacterium]
MGPVDAIRSTASSWPALGADAVELKRLPHDVVVSERLLARIGHDPGEAVQA